MSTKIDLKKIPDILKNFGEKIKEFIWAIGNHAFLAIIILIFIDILIGGWMSYKYVYLSERKNIEVDGAFFKFKDDAYQNILQKWEKRDNDLQESLEKNYSDPFK